MSFEISGLRFEISDLKSHAPPRRAPRLRRVGCCALLVAMAMLLAAPGDALAAGPADQQFTFAVRLMKEGERELADEAFTDFVRDFPNDRRVDDAYYYRALLARQTGDRDAARKLLGNVDDPLHVDDAAVKLLDGQLALEAGQTGQAIAAFESIDEKAIEDHETRLTWHYLRGLAYDRQGNPTAAATQFDKAAEADSSVRDRALLALGKTRIRLKQFAPAMDALTRAAKTSEDPERSAEARRLAADLAYQLKQYEQSAAYYQHIVENQQSTAAFADAVMGLLRSLLAADQPDKLITRHKNLAQHVAARHIGEAFYLKAAAHVKLGEHEQALDALDSYDQRTDDDHPLVEAARYLRGLSLFNTDAEAFERWYARAKPSSRELGYLRAAAAVQRDKPEDAIRYLTPLTAPADAPYAKRALLQRANLYDRLDQPRQAADDYAAFAKRYGDDPQARPVLRRAVDLAFRSDQHEQVVDLAGQWLEGAGRDEQTAAVRLKLAVSLIRTEAQDKALAQLETTLAGKPSDRVAALAHFYRGLVLAGRVDAEKPETLESAIAALERALGGALPETQQTEALAMSARLNRVAGNDEAALAAYEKLRSIRSAGDFDPAVALWVGRGMVQAGQAAEALPWLSVVAENDRADERYRAQAMFFRARALHNLERWREAVDAYRRLLAFSKAYGNQAQLGLAQTLAASGNDRVEDALDEYNALLNVRDTRVAATALYESALLYLRLAARAEQAGFERGATESRKIARKRLNRLVLLYDLPQLGSLPLKAMHRLGLVLADAGEPAMARQQFDKLIEREGKPAWAKLAEAEKKLLADPPQTTGARQTLEALIREHADGEAAALAEQRLKEIGGSS